MAKRQENLENLIESTIKSDIKKVSPSQTSENLLPDKVVIDIVETLSDTFGIKNNTVTMSAIFLLFLKGAANVGTPNTVEVEVVDDDGTKTSIQKYDLLYAYQRITNNKYLRRLAETLATPIGKYAEANRLSGDLAEKINTKVLSKKAVEGEAQEPILSAKERAWCSSFGQNVPDLEKTSERLPRLLAEDYLSRFNKPTRKNKPDEVRNLPRKAPLQRKSPPLFKGVVVREEKHKEKGGD